MNSRRITSISAATILGAALLSGTAAAESPGDPTVGRNNCAYNVDTKEIRCFATLGEVRAYVAASLPALAQTSALGPLTVGVMTIYDGGINSSPSYTAFGSCGSGSANIPSYMNDKASSMEVGGGCVVKLYEHSGLGGSYGIYGAGTHTGLGAMNNKASSYMYYT